MNTTQNKETFEEWLARAGRPYTEVRYAGKPHECVAINVAGMGQSFYRDLFHLSDRAVTAVVSGPFVETQPRSLASEVAAT